MSQWEPKLGDVVTLRGAPQMMMTVTGYDPKTAMYGVLWLDNEGHPHGVNLSPRALVEVTEEEPIDPAVAQAALQHAAAAVTELNQRCQQLTEMNHSAGAQLAELVTALRRLVPKDAWSSEPSAMAEEAIRRHETFQREANEQLVRLQAKVAELGG